ncbi:MAG TPA: response regulator transcription factor [Acidimicrobiia bacterium]
MQPGGETGPGAPARDHIRVVVVDDHEMVVEALIRTLASEPDVEVVGRAGSSEQAITVARERGPDVVVIGSGLPDGTGPELTGRIRAALPGTAVVGLGLTDDDAERADALAAGASVFVWKGQPVEALLDAIRFAATGALPPAGMPAARRSGPELTGREREVLALLAEGLSTDEIVEHLVLSPHTVRNHIRSVLAKLGAHSRLEAVAVAARAGLIRLAHEPPARQ